MRSIKLHHRHSTPRRLNGPAKKEKTLFRPGETAQMRAVQTGGAPRRNLVPPALAMCAACTMSTQQFLFAPCGKEDGLPVAYPTTLQLGFYPLLKAGIVDAGNVIADAKSGVSGAGRKAEMGTPFSEASKACDKPRCCRDSYAGPPADAAGGPAHSRFTSVRPGATSMQARPPARQLLAISTPRSTRCA
jgi:hypothetical protein